VENIIKKSNLEILGQRSPLFDEILTDDALLFIEAIENKFGERRKQLLRERENVQIGIDEGLFPDFLPETKSIRDSEWKVAPPPPDLMDRRVEITGPVDRKMIINALNSSARVFMADFEDSNSPTWKNNINGQINLRDAANRTINFTNINNGKIYKLNNQIATLMVRPRGWHLEEKNILFNNSPISASIFDFALYFYHNAKTLIKNGTGPYFYFFSRKIRNPQWYYQSYRSYRNYTCRI